MITVLEYVVIAVVIAAVLFVIAALIFGRGEQMAALPARTSPSELPVDGLRGDHVRAVRFGLALRGYRMSDVDWTLERLADEIDSLRAQLAAADGTASEPDQASGRAEVTIGAAGGSATPSRSVWAGDEQWRHRANTVGDDHHG